MTIEQLLKDPHTVLDGAFLETVLGENITLWNTLNERLSHMDMSTEWRHYKDGGWLGKTVHKKKTIFWGSLSDGFFSAGFNFPEKPHLKTGILELDISEDIKNSLVTTPKGAYFGFTVHVHSEKELADLYKLIEYKKTAK